MKGSKSIILIACLLAFSNVANAIDLSKINMAYLYDLNADIKMKYRVVKTENELSLYYELQADNLNNWSQTLIRQKSNNSVAHDTINALSTDTLKFTSNKITGKINLPELVKGYLLVLIYTSTSYHETAYFDVDFSLLSSIPSFYPLADSGLPLFDSYIKSDTMGFLGPDATFHVYQYDHSFRGTSPPMGQMGAIAPSFKIDSSYFFQSYLTDLYEDNFYLIQTDSLDQRGITMLKVPSYYPDTKRIEELIGPLQYITTNSENKSLNSGVDTKRVFEKFWINTYGSKFLAKEAIRSYYSKVRASNLLFTDYRAGWKTDRGMLYIIFGAPKEVIRTKYNEVWKYDNDLTFEFIRISTLFAPSFYSLKRDRGYEDIWYNRIANLRND